MYSQKFKIEVILRSSPDRQLIEAHQKTKKYPVRKDSNQNEMIYGRNSSAPFPFYKQKQGEKEADECIDLRQKIITSKECLGRPSTLKQKQCQLFTQKCLSILSRKKKNLPNPDSKLKMHDMMSNIVEKYKYNAQNQKKNNFMKNSGDISTSYPKTRVYERLTGYEDKIQVYRMLKSTESSRESDDRVFAFKKEQDWKQKPDVTGVRMNKFLKSQPHDIQGVQCFSLPISGPPVTTAKRYSAISSQVGFIQRSISQNSSRKKINITRNQNNKFMAFSKNDPDALYTKKLKSFFDFIFKINFSNKIYVSLSLSDDTINIKKYKVYVGRGNNSLLLKSLLRRRFWMEIVDDPEEEGINFFWTQNKIDRVHYKQKVSKQFRILYDKENPEKRRDLKTADERETQELNKKILAGDQVSRVEKFILKNGYVIPFDETYTCSLLSNHIPRNNCIGSKKNLFKSLFFYYRDYLKTDPFNYIPKTYSIKNSEDPQFKKFLKDYDKQPNKVWIVKPGENTNRGNGIKLAETKKVVEFVRRKQKHSNGQLKTYILQSYIDKPFLYNNRKFDIRHYMMITSVNGILKAYWYKEGYLRTSSEKFDIEDLDNQVMHLTNDAIQKNYDDYEKYEPGNKLSYSDFQRYLDMTYPAKGYNFERDIVPAMKSIILDVVKANYNTLDKNRRESNFQIFGFDFMIDKEFKPWLIQINYNPCLEINCPLLSRIIPVMVESSLRVGLDPLLPPMNHYSGSKRYTLSDNYLKNLRYELIFDESTFSQTVPILYDIDDSDDEEQEYCDDGKQIDELVM